jgi:hypothetical protein
MIAGQPECRRKACHRARTEMLCGGAANGPWVADHKNYLFARRYRHRRTIFSPSA